MNESTPSPLDAVIEATLHDVAAATSRAEPAASELIAPVHALARGGKRLRSRLLLSAHRAVDGANENAALLASAAIELFQAAALLHDDVIDGSDTRRGSPTAHRTLAADHRRRGWRGDADAFGAAGAILAGDLALMAHQRVAHRAVQAADAAGPLVAELLSEMAETVTAGQFLDMRLAVAPISEIGSQAASIESLMLTKTASYTAEFPLAIGATIGGARTDVVDAMRAIGRDVGVAFQLRDDLLGLAGDPLTTGKPAGDDVREGKRTLALALAWNHTDDAGRAAIERALGHADASDAAVSAVVDVAIQSGAVATVETKIASLRIEANDRLDSLALDAAGADELRTLVTRATDRTA